LYPPRYVQVLTLLQRLTNVLGAACGEMAPLVVPVLDYALDPAGPEALNLLEDALLLWIVMLRHAPDTYTEPLRLWRHYGAIMGATLEHVPACAMAAFSAVLLGGAPFVQVCAQQKTANGLAPSLCLHDLLFGRKA
jgi:hypothetical protein